MPFWRKWVIDSFEVDIGQKIFWQNFGQFGPFPVRVTQRSSGGQNSKMLQMTFHVYQITREVIRITKTNLLCVRCLVREILRKGHPKVKCGQIFNISSYSSKLAHSKKYKPLSYLSFHFWNKPFCLNSDRDCSGRSTLQNGDYWLQEIRLQARLTPHAPRGFSQTIIFGNLIHRPTEIRLSAKIPTLGEAVRALFSKWPPKYNI